MPSMARPDLILRAEPGFALPAFERVAPLPSLTAVASRIEAASSPGDVVLDLNSRGGWVGRAAIDRQRRAIIVESNPLTRLLAEVVLRPPDIRHLDAAFQAISAAPRQQSSLKVSIGDTFATRCPRCGRNTVADEFIWEAVGGSAAVELGDAAAGAGDLAAGAGDAAAGAAGPEAMDAAEPVTGTARTPDDAARPARLVRKYYRCLTCRDQVGGGDQRHAPVDEADEARAVAVEAHGPAWRALRERFPTPEGADGLADELLGLHTPRQLVGLHAILERIDTDLRAAPVEAALRLSLLHAILPASRLNGFPGRVAGVRISGGRLRQPSGREWRERNPWLAFEEGYRIVRGFVQRLEGSAPGPIQARFGDDVRSLAEGAVTAVVRVATPTGLRALSAEGAALRHQADRPHVRLLLGEPPLRPSQERLSYTYLATCWVLGRDAASLLPLDALAGPAGRVPWSWQAAAMRRGLAAAEPLLERDARAILLVESGGPEALIAAVLGGVGAGYRLVSARFGEPGEELGGTVELVPPGGALPGGPRTRANVPLPPVAGGPGDPDIVPGRGVFAPPERFDQRPFSATEVGRTVTETAVAVLQARGEPARYDHLLGEILVGLDRAGQLRRLAAPDATARDAGGEAVDTLFGGPLSASSAASAPTSMGGVTGEAAGPPAGATDAAPGRPPAGETVLERARRHAREPLGPGGGDPVESLLELVRGELSRPDQRRLAEIEPGRWWLVSRDDQAAAAPPLADRVEWAVFSLLSTAGHLSEGAFFERIDRLFGGYDLADEALVRACLESYRSRASTTDALQTGDDLLRRSAEHGELIALLADLGHRLGMSVWIARREQERRVRGRPLLDWLDTRERNAYLPLIARAPAAELEQVDCIWYVRGRAVLLFEVEWTAMLAEPVLRRHAAIPAEEGLVRFLVTVPERTELVRFKIDRSPLLRAALDRDNWHVLKSNHLRTLAARESVALADLEPFLGLDAAADRSGDQLALFE